MRWWLFLPADIYFAGLGVYFGARLAVGYRFWPVELVSQFIHLLLLPAFPLLIMLLLSRHWLRAAAAGGGILAFGWLFGGLFLPPAATSFCNEGSAGCQTLTVMSYNAGSGLAEPATLVDMLRNTEADIIGLQELSPRQATYIRRELAEEYPYHALYGGTGAGRGLLSRYPIVEEELVDVVWEHLPPYLEATVDVEGTLLTVIVFRAHTPRLGVYTPKTGFAYYTWRSGDILAEEATTQAPAILLTDFNTTDQSAEYGRLRAGGLRDAFREGGWGFGFTFPARADGWRKLIGVPLLRIDYVWVTADLEVARAWVGPDAGSDHLPVLATLVWQTE